MYCFVDGKGVRIDFKLTDFFTFLKLVVLADLQFELVECFLYDGAETWAAKLAAR